MYTIAQTCDGFLITWMKWACKINGTVSEMKMHKQNNFYFDFFWTFNGFNFIIEDERKTLTIQDQGKQRPQCNTGRYSNYFARWSFLLFTKYKVYFISPLYCCRVTRGFNSRHFCESIKCISLWFPRNCGE